MTANTENRASTVRAGCTVARQKQSISGTESSLDLHSLRKITFELSCRTRSCGSAQQSRSDVSQIAPLSSVINNCGWKSQTDSQEEALQRGVMNTLQDVILASRYASSLDQTFGWELPAVHFHLNNSLFLSWWVRLWLNVNSEHVGHNQMEIKIMTDSSRHHGNWYLKKQSYYFFF